MHEFVWSLPPMKLRMRNENDTLGNVHHKLITTKEDENKSEIHDLGGGTVVPLGTGRPCHIVAHFA